MQVSASTLLKSKRPSVGKLKIGDRVAFAGNVLRVLPGDSRPLLILLEGNGQKITVASAALPNGRSSKAAIG